MNFGKKGKSMKSLLYRLDYIEIIHQKKVKRYKNLSIKDKNRKYI